MNNGSLLISIVAVIGKALASIWTLGGHECGKRLLVEMGETRQMLKELRQLVEKHIEGCDTHA